MICILIYNIGIYLQQEIVPVLAEDESVYKLITFGSLVYENNLKSMEKVIPNYWQIKSVDVLRSRNYFPSEQKEKIIDEYITTTGMKGIINATHLASFNFAKRFNDLIVIQQVVTSYKNIITIFSFY